MDAASFRAESELTTAASELLRKPIMLQILQVLENESPHRKPVNSTRVEGIIVTNETLSSVQLGKIAGWTECLETLRSLGKSTVKRTEVDVEQNYLDPLPPDEPQPEESNA